jgi:lipid-A-disaccharide synthase
VRRLIEPFGETVSLLLARGHQLRLLLPTVPHVAEMVRSSVAAWPQQPEVVFDADRKWRAFGEADAALIASGTVSLELALSGVPMVSTYKLDPVIKPIIQRTIRVWSALLPNLIADRALIPEFYDQYVRPDNLARQLEALFTDTEMRAWQKDGFAEVRRRMETDRPAGEIAAGAVMELVKGRARQ